MAQKNNIWNWFKSSKDETTDNSQPLSIELERQIGEQIYNALQGNIVEEVLREIKTSSSSDAYWRSNMEGHSLKVEKELLPDFYQLCHEVN